MTDSPSHDRSKDATQEGEGEQGRTLVLICTYNELENLPTLIPAILEVAPDCDVLVVDDNSPDGTSDWVREYGQNDSRVRIETRTGKLGLGTAIVHGIKIGMSQGYDWIINLDADWSHDPAAIKAMIRYRQDQQGPIDLLIGSRYVPGGGMKNCSWKRHLVSRCANLYTRGLLGIKTRDCSSAYRCYRPAFFSKFDFGKIRCRGYGYLEEVLFLAMRQGARVEEIPIVYTERVQGESKISIREAWDTIMAINRLFLKRIGWSK